MRASESINLVGAFEEAVTEPTRIPAAISRLACHATEVHETFGETPVAAWTFGPGDRLAAIVTRGDTDANIGALGERCRRPAVVTALLLRPAAPLQSRARAAGSPAAPPTALRVSAP